jgi:hypothetical protein
LPAIYNCYGHNSQVLNLYLLRKDSNDSGMNAAYPTIAAEQEAFRFAAGEIRTIDEPEDGVVIHCTSGAAWVTQAGVSEDIVLEAGMSYRPRGSGKVAIQGLFGAIGISLERDDVNRSKSHERQNAMTPRTERERRPPHLLGLLACILNCICPSAEFPLPPCFASR